MSIGLLRSFDVQQKRSDQEQTVGFVICRNEEGVPMKSKMIVLGMGWLLITLSSVNAATNYCNHVLFPIQPQAEWTYNQVVADSETEGYTLSVQTVFTRGDKTTASVNFISTALGNISYPLLFECSESNGMTLVELNNIVIPLPDGSAVKLMLNEQSGTILPPINVLTTGYSWPFVLDFKGSYTPAKGKPVAVNMRVEVTSMLSEILDTMEVAAGAFKHVFVIQQDVSIQLTIARMKKPIRTLGSVRTWYLAEAVGPVSAEFLNMISELISYSLPNVAIEPGAVLP